MNRLIQNIPGVLHRTLHNTRYLFKTTAWHHLSSQMNVTVINVNSWLRLPNTFTCCTTN